MANLIPMQLRLQLGQDIVRIPDRQQVKLLRSALGTAEG
jgi:hypothetical protein